MYIQRPLPVFVTVQGRSDDAVERLAQQHALYLDLFLTRKDKTINKKLKYLWPIIKMFHKIL